MPPTRGRPLPAPQLLTLTLVISGILGTTVVARAQCTSAALPHSSQVGCNPANCPAGFNVVDCNSVGTPGCFGTTIIGTSGADCIYGVSGANNELIIGNGGGDIICGDGGDDTIVGGDGVSDEVNGGDGADNIAGGSGADCLLGEGGNDTIDGGEGADEVYGGAGNDTVQGGGGSDVISGEAGNDTLYGELANDDTAGGSAGNDVLNGGSDADVLFGQDGNDTLSGENENDFLDAGNGSSQFCAGSNGTDHCVNCDFTLSCESLTYVDLSEVQLFITPSGVRVLYWKTAAEVGAMGFTLSRYSHERDAFLPVHDRHLLAANAPEGAQYYFVDPSQEGPVGQGTGASYRLEEQEITGSRYPFGPFHLTPEDPAGTPHAFAVARAAEQGYFIRRRTPRAVVTASPSPASGPTTSPVSGEPRTTFVLTCDKPGLQRVDPAALAHLAGLELTQLHRLVQNHGLQLSYLGSEVPWLQDPTGAPVFYLPKDNSPFSAEKKVLLHLNVRGAKLTHTATAGDQNRDPVAAVRYRSEVAPDRFAALAASTEPDEDFWYQAVVTNLTTPEPSPTITVPTPHGERSQGGTLAVSLLGAPIAGALEHRVSVQLNGTTLGEARFSPGKKAILSFPVPPRGLRRGDQSVRLQVTGEHGTTTHERTAYVDAVSIEYTRTPNLSADTPRLTLEASTSGQVHMPIPAGEQAWVWDVTEPRAPRSVDTTVNGHVATFGVTRGQRYHATLVSKSHDPHITPARAALADGLFVHEARRDTHGYVVITSKALLPAALRLASHRAGRDNPRVVTTEEVYFTVAHGERSVEHLRRFISKAAAHWKTHTVVLFGAGSYDYRGGQNLGGDHVIVPMMPTDHGLAAGDSAVLCTPVGVACGRIPARTLEEADAAVEKIVRHDRARTTTSRSLTVSEFAEQTQYQELGDALQALLPFEHNVGLHQRDLPQVRNLLKREWGQDGADFVFYAGHGGLDRFGRKLVLSVDDVAELAPSHGNLPIVLAASCLTAAHAMPGHRALGAALVTAERAGAVAFIGASGVTVHEATEPFMAILYDELFHSDTPTIGLALLRAQQRFAQRATPEERAWASQYQLLGDPGMPLRKPGATSDAADVGELASRNAASGLSLTAAVAEGGDGQVAATAPALSDGQGCGAGQLPPPMTWWLLTAMALIIGRSSLPPTLRP